MPAKKSAKGKAKADNSADAEKPKVHLTGTVIAAVLTYLLINRPV